MRASIAIGLLVMATAGCDQNMNDNVHYDLEAKEEPSAWVHIPLQDAQETEMFFRILREFAEHHGIPESRLRSASRFPTPQFKSAPMYQSSNVIISSFAVVAPEDRYGQSRMSVLRRDFVPADFKRLADDYLDRFRAAFTNRVQSTFEDNRK